MRYEFFYGLDGGGVATTIEEYTKEGWVVRFMGTDAEGFWLLLFHVVEYPGGVPDL
jgi:hypothetical protein